MLLFTIYCAERATPSVDPVEADATYLMAAFFATAPDHSTSNSASISSSRVVKPGSVPLTITVGSFGGRPKLLRNACTSVRLKVHRPTMAIDRPLPSMELEYKPP